jgi:nucleoside transporter
MNGVRFKLSAMMFLEFFIWGAWYPLIFGYLPSLKFGDWEQPLILGTFNLAAVLALFFSTQFADRNFAAERFLSFSHLIGGLAILALFWIKKPEGEASAPFWPFFGLLLLHSIFYVPTISITNSIAFANLRDPQKEFGQVRLWGTIGWIAAAWPLFFLLRGKEGAEFRQATSYIFVVAGVASLVLAGFSLSLPHTPPKPAGATGEKLAWLEAMRLLAIPFVLVLFIVTFLDSGVHQIYFSWTERFLTTPSDRYGVGISGEWAMPVMSIGQVAEIGTLAFLALALKRLGWRYTMVIGILGHAVRFTVFALLPYAVPAILANLLHGICYAFFFATVYMFVDEFFPKDARSSAQGLFNVLILGVGPFFGNFLGTRLGTVFKVGEYLDSAGNPQPIIDFSRLFLVPAGIALLAAIVLLVFFRPPEKKEAEQKEPGSATH